jgi:sugar phosphate isomerase/epimerase
MSGGIGRLSVNQWTVRSLGVPELVEACARHGIEAAGLWREPVADYGVARSAKLVRDAGLRVSSLCRAGFFNRPGWLDDNRAAIDEAAALGAACLVLVAGGLPAAGPDAPAAGSPGSAWDAGTVRGVAGAGAAGPGGPGGRKDLAGARARAIAAIAELVPYAAGAGVRLAIEPMHPMYCADRGVLSTLAQALDVVAVHPAETVGVVIDTFHLWWDPGVLAQIARAGRDGRIASFQVSDFLLQLPADVLLGRAMMGDGVIDFGPLCRAVSAAGYAGDVEVEIFNADVWAADPDDVLARTKDRYTALIAGELARETEGLDAAAGAGRDRWHGEHRPRARPSARRRERRCRRTARHDRGGHGHR